MILFRNCDRRWPFLWESAGQPAARWHAPGDGPAQYFADTPDGAWAEFLRHEEITDPVDLQGVSRAMWSLDVAVDEPATPDLPTTDMIGGLDTYPSCQAEARRLRDRGATAIEAPSAALHRNGACGYRVALGLRQGPPRDGRVVVAFGTRPDAVGWQIVDEGRPPAELLSRVRSLS